MLDQNTDRMWYVIGAIMIGAAILLLINGAAPDLFAQVAGTYEEKTEEATNAADELYVGGIRPNLLLGTHDEWREYGGHLNHTIRFGKPSDYRPIADMGLEPGDNVTFSGDVDLKDDKHQPRINFSPVPYDTDDEREMSRTGEHLTGKQKFSFTTTVPEGTKYLRVMFNNGHDDFEDRLEDIEPIKARRLKLEEGTNATKWVS